MMAKLKKRKSLMLFAALVLVGAGYWFYRSRTATTGVTTYGLAAAAKDTVVASVSGTGQVASSNQIDIKPDVSGDIVLLGIQEGQEVKQGTLLAMIDDTDAQKAVRDAQTSLESAQLSLEKMKKPADALSLLQSQDSLTQAQETLANANDNLNRAYDDGYTSVSNTFLDLPAVMTGMQNILYGTDVNSGQQANIDYFADVANLYDTVRTAAYKSAAIDSYAAARAAYEQNYSDYKASSHYSSREEIGRLIDQSYETSKKVAEAVKNADNLIRFYEDKLTERNLKPKTLADTYLSSVASYLGKVNSHVSDLLGSSQSIANTLQSIQSANRTIAERTQSLADLKAGADPLDIRSQQLSVEQRQNALLDARAKLKDYVIHAPIDGIIAKLNIRKGDAVSSGTVLATLIAKQGMVTISLNEVDVSKAKIGQKATMTFDAVPDLTVTGKVTNIDTLGTVSQGVVTYNVKIAMDTQEPEVKPGMSVSASVITDSRVDVLTVPNAAIKSGAGGNSYYVEMIDGVPAGQTSVTGPATLRRQPVTVGLANDELTEITGGLNEGDMVVVRTSTSNAAAATTQGGGLFGLPAGRIGGASTGGVRIQTGGGNTGFRN